MNNLFNRWLLFALIVGFFLRLVFLSGPSINGDEGDNWAGAKDWFEKGISGWQRWGGTLPPVSIVSMGFFLYFFDDNEFALRLSSVIYGLLTIVCIYCIAKLHFDKKTAVIGVFLAAVLPFLVILNRDAHPDSALIFFTTATVLFFELAFRYNSMYAILAGIAGSLALLSKINAVLLLGPYIAYALVQQQRSKPQTPNPKPIFLVAAIAGLLTMLVAVQSFENLVYLAQGFAHWIPAQTGGSHPWHYYFAVLFEALSPVVFMIFVPLLFSSFFNKQRRFYAILIGLFCVIVLLMGRKFPRHIFPIVPFITILVGSWLAKRSKFVIVLVLLLTGAWTVQKMFQYSDYTVWKDVGTFVNSLDAKSIFVDGVEYWTLVFYAPEKNITSKLDAGLLRNGSIVVVHNLKSGPYIIGQPFQNDLFFWQPEYLHNYLKQDFYAKAEVLGKKLASFPYDNKNNTIEVWLITKDSDIPPAERKLSRPKPLQMACSLRNKDGFAGNLFRMFLSDVQLWQLEMKCTRGCIYTCDIF